MKKIYTIGRDSGCDIVIPDNTDVTSRLHATLRVESNGKIYLTDQSLNGTYVNGMKMSSNVEIPVSRNDVVSFAHIYNLDWNLVPKQKNGAIGIVISIIAVIAISAAGIYLYLSYKDVPQNPEPEKQNVKKESPTPKVIKKDTPAVKTDNDNTKTEKPEVTAPEKPKQKEEKPQEEKKEEKPQEEKKEENNPIFIY